MDIGGAKTLSTLATRAGLSARAHGARIGVEPTVNLLDQMLMGPARHPAFLAGAAGP